MGSMRAAVPVMPLPCHCHAFIHPLLHVGCSRLLLEGGGGGGARPVRTYLIMSQNMVPFHDHCYSLVVDACVAVGGCHAAEEVQGQVQWEPPRGDVGLLAADGPGLLTPQSLSVT